MLKLYRLPILVRYNKLTLMNFRYNTVTRGFTRVKLGRKISYSIYGKYIYVGHYGIKLINLNTSDNHDIVYRLSASAGV